MRHFRTHIFVTLLALLAAGQVAQGAIRHTYSFEAHTNNSLTQFIIKNGNGAVVLSTPAKSLDTYQFDNVEINIGNYTMLINGTISAVNGEDGVNAVDGGIRITFSTTRDLMLVQGRIATSTASVLWPSQNNVVEIQYGILVDAYFKEISLDFSPIVGLDAFSSLGPDTYAIKTKDDLLNLGYLVNYNNNNCSGLTFRQTADIDFDMMENEPIGRGEDNSFQGTYDGQDHSISRIVTSRVFDQDPNCLGIFGYIKYGIVQNIYLNTVSISGRSQIGSVAGYNNGGIVRNCRVENTDLQVNPIMDLGWKDSYGGIVGYNDGGTVIGCLSSATISSGNIYYSGGIVGNCNNGTIRDCLYCGNQVVGTSQVGSIVGHVSNSVDIFNNYYTTRDLGGLHGGDIVGACRVREIQLKDSNFAIDGSLIPYNVSGLTAIGSSALIYTIAENHTKIYSGEGQTIHLTYTGNVPAGSAPAYWVNGTRIAGNSFTMPATDVAVKSDLVAAPPINVTGHFSDGVYWSTFRHGILRYALPEGAAAYTMDSEKHLYRLGDDGRVIPAGVAVVIIADKENITLTYDSGTADITDHAPDPDHNALTGGNILKGSSSTVMVSDLFGTPYMLGVVDDVFGFHPYNGIGIPANKAYYIIKP